LETDPILDSLVICMPPLRKAILTGGGRATRLRPITATINKHLIPLANKPMIFHAIEKVVEIGVEEIFINTNPGETELQRAIGDGGHWGVKIQFFEQEGGPQGIAHVVKQAERFIGHDPFLFYLSDNILLGSLHGLVEEFQREAYDCLLALSRVPDPERFGIPLFDEAGQMIDVLEKPSNPPNPFAITGIYFYAPRVFFEAFDHIQKSGRGEYEISSIHSYFLQHGRRVGHREITGLWKDTGKTEDLILANQFLLDQMPPDRFQITEPMDPSARVRGHVHIGLGTTIGPGVTIQGPAIIGENCTLERCTILPYTTLGTGCTITDATISASIIFPTCQISSDVHIHESIIGEKVVIKKHPEKHQRLILGDHTFLEM